MTQTDHPEPPRTGLARIGAVLRKLPLAAVWNGVVQVSEFLKARLMNLLLIATLFGIATLSYQQLRRSPVVVEAISVPPALKSSGFTQEVATHRLWDAISTIQDASNTDKASAKVTSQARQLDIIDTSSGLSLQGVTAMLRAVFNLPETRVTGELVCGVKTCDWSVMRLRVRVYENGVLYVHDIVPQGTEDDSRLFEKAALETLRTVDPLSLAAYLYNEDTTRAEGLDLAKTLLLDAHKDRAWAAELLGFAADEQGDLEKARVWYEMAVELAQEDGRPDFDLPLTNLGYAFFDIGEHEEALLLFERAAKVNRRSVEAWVGWGETLLALERYEDAAQKYKRAIRLDPRSSFTWTGLADTQWGLGDLDAALDSYQRAAQIDPMDGYAWQGWGDVLDDRGDVEGAREKYQQASESYRFLVTLEPEDITYFSNWGYSLEQLGAHAEAAGKFEIATTLDPEDGYSWVGWAYNLAEQGLNLEAIEKYRRATEVDSEDAYSWFGLALNLAALGRVEEALAIYPISLEHDNAYIESAEAWGVDLADYLQADPGKLCARATVYAPEFLARTASLIQADSNYVTIETSLNGCR